jgi:hypothetical protein
VRSSVVAPPRSSPYAKYRSDDPPRTRTLDNRSVTTRVHDHAPPLGTPSPIRRPKYAFTCTVVNDHVDPDCVAWYRPTTVDPE